MKLVQCELATGEDIEFGYGDFTMTWVPAELKPKAGMRLSTKGDPRVWVVMKAYTLIPMDAGDIHSSWKVGLE